MKKDNRVEEASKELEEHRDVVKYLRGKLNEVNLLNGKLYSKISCLGYGLNNEQKLKVVETFDRAKFKRSQVGIFNFGESFGGKKNEALTRVKVRNSQKAKSTQKPKEVIQEGSGLRDRFKKLGNIL